MIKNLLGDDDEKPATEDSAANRAYNSRSSLSLFDSDDTAGENSDKFVLSEAEPETFAETARRSGMAWSAGIAFFASVVFMLIIGWFADLLFGSSPWGIVGGIVVGSLIGFVQLFRLASQIFKK